MRQEAGRSGDAVDGVLGQPLEEALDLYGVRRLEEMGLVRFRFRLGLIKKGLYKGRERYWVIGYWVEK